MVVKVVEWLPPYIKEDEKEEENLRRTLYSLVIFLPIKNSNE
jgi:hypothetical protein